MLTTQAPRPGLLFASFLYRSDLHSEAKLIFKWESIFGKGFSYQPAHNPLTQYYSQEMGPAETLSRFFIITAQTFPKEYLLSTKLLSLEWEKEYSSAGLRSINVDVGFLSLENFVLATTKNYSHRIYLGQNIFADLTYHFHLGKFDFLPWTYPDFRDEKKVEFLSWARSYLLQKLSTLTQGV